MFDVTRHDSDYEPRGDADPQMASKEAEQATLGSMLIDPGCIPHIVKIVKGPGDFFYQENRVIYAVLSGMHYAELVIDLVELKEILEKNGKLAAVGGAEYLASLVDSTPTAKNAKGYAKTVRAYAKMRGRHNDDAR